MTDLLLQADGTMEKRHGGSEVVLPTREVYLKGPGMIFKGNPRNFLTEIQMLIK